jgi:hypothetical protein
LKRAVELRKRLQSGSDSWSNDTVVTLFAGGG